MSQDNMVKTDYEVDARGEACPMPLLRAKLQLNNMAEGESVKVTDYRNQNITLQANATGSNFLLLSEVYYPEWKAFIDGKETEIVKSNYLLTNNTLSFYLSGSKRLWGKLFDHFYDFLQILICLTNILDL